MNTRITIRHADKTDRDFIFSLSPELANVAKLSWHDEKTMQNMQDGYITDMLDNTSVPHVVLVAEKVAEENVEIKRESSTEKTTQPVGFIHVCQHKDSISNELCASVTLLAVLPDTQGLGIGKALINSAEHWAKTQGYRLLHLEVFANNNKAQGFYKNVGFEAETLHMIKTIG